MTKKTTILGTIRKQRQEVPNTESLMKDKLSHDSEIFSSPSDCSLTVYKAKKKENRLHLEFYAQTRKSWWEPQKEAARNCSVLQEI